MENNKIEMFPKFSSIKNTINEFGGSSIDSIVNTLYTKYKGKKDWLKLVTKDLKSSGETKKVIYNIIDMLHGEDYFDDADDYEYENNSNESIINESNTPDISSLVSELFQSRDVAHIVHLATDSFAQHKALNEYYDDIVDLVDSFVESYQGLYGKIVINIPASNAQPMVEYLTVLHKNVDNFKTPDMNGELASTLDEISGLISSTLYKLKELD